jgi:hypothetical protein
VADEWCGGKRARAALDEECAAVAGRWAREARGVADTVPRLEGTLAWPAAVGEALAHGDLVATRVPADAPEVAEVLRACFHARYADDAAAHAAALGPCAAAYAVAGRADGQLRAAFVVHAYRCTFADGEAGAAALVDSFGVLPAYRRRKAKGRWAAGVGGAVYEHLLVPLVERLARRGVRFAQCLTSAAAAPFWRFKLDETREARALALQALHLTPDSFVPNPEATVSLRAREWVADAPPADAPPAVMPPAADGA